MTDELRKALEEIFRESGWTCQKNWDGACDHRVCRSSLKIREIARQALAASAPADAREAERERVIAAAWAAVEAITPDARRVTMDRLRAALDALDADARPAAAESAPPPPGASAAGVGVALVYEPWREVLSDLLLFTSTVLKMANLDHMLKSPELEAARQALAPASAAPGPTPPPAGDGARWREAMEIVISGCQNCGGTGWLAKRPDRDKGIECHYCDEARAQYESLTGVDLPRAAADNSYPPPGGRPASAGEKGE